MSIPASKVVRIYPRLLTAGGTDLEILGLLLTENELAVFPSVMSFDSKAAVELFFGTESDEYNLASKYFLGFDNSDSKPRSLLIARRVSKAIAGFIRGGTVTAKLSDFKAMTTGTLKMKIDATEIYFEESIDFSPATSLSAVAEIVQTYIREVKPDVSVTYSSLAKAFCIKSGTTGENSSVEFAEESDVASIMMIGEFDGGIISGGSDTLSPDANMNSIMRQTQNFVTFSTVYKAADAEGIALAEWSTGQMDEYLYVHWSKDGQLISQTDTSSFARQMIELNLSGTTGVYGDAEYAAFIMGIAGSIDWERKNGAITFKFKSQEGLAPTVTDGNVLDILVKKQFNCYGRFATRNDTHIFLAEGSMFGKWGFIDTFINGIWLRNTMQLSLVEGLKTSKRTPYLTPGYTKIKAWIADPVERAINNGVIEKGLKLSNTQKAELFSEAGQDISTNILTEGYFFQITDPAPIARTNRESPVLAFWYAYGSSIHKIDLPVTTIV